MKCPNCGKDVVEGNFCTVCIANLITIIDTKVPICHNCKSPLPGSGPINGCPICGAYQAWNIRLISPALVQAARTYPRNMTFSFCSYILKLEKRPANTLCKHGLTAVEILALRYEQIDAIRNFGESGWWALQNAIKDWKSPEE